MVVFTVGFLIITRSMYTRSWGECGCILFILLVLEVMMLLVWLKFIEDWNRDAASWHRATFTVTRTFPPPHNHFSVVA